MKKIVLIAFALLAACSMWAQAPSTEASSQPEVTIDSQENSAINKMNADTIADQQQQAPASATEQMPEEKPEVKAESGYGMIVTCIALFVALIACVLAFLAKKDAAKAKAEKDDEIAALKTALHKRGEDLEESLRRLENRLIAVESAKSGTSAPVRVAAKPKASPGATATAEPRRLFLTRPDDRGYFIAASTRMEPGNSIFVLTTLDGLTGTFEVIDDAGVHQLALMMPTENLTRACTGKNIQVSAGMSAIVTDAPGVAKKEGTLWRIVEPAEIHYEN